MMTRTTLSIAISALLLAGCGGGSDNTVSNDDGNTNASGDGNNSGDQQQREVSSQQVDASDHNESIYLNLNTGSTLNLTAAEASASTDWHLAFQRNDIKLNGGNTGPGNVAGAVAAEQADFYNDDGSANASVFLNATADSESEHLMASMSEPSSWTSDAVVTEFGDAWYTYDFQTHTVSANSDNGWLLRAGESDSYARMRVNQFDYPSADGDVDFAIDFDVQPSGASQFTQSASFAGNIPASGGEVCFDFNGKSTTGCDTANWDLKVGVQGRSLYLRSNSGVSGDGDGGVFGPMAWSEISTYTSATTTPGGGDISTHYSADTTGGVFSDSSWYAYNLQGQHQLWPNYRVYLIDTDTTDDQSTVYALQVISYYNDAGTSGHPRVRWVEVDLGAEQ